MMKSILNILLAISFLGFLTSMKSTVRNEQQIVNAPATVSFTDGQQLWEKNCALCHGPSAQLAPTMADFAAAYEVDDVTEKQFVKDIVKFVQNPTVESSKMPEAVEKYKLMGKLPVSEKDLKEIASYIYQVSHSAAE